MSGDLNAWPLGDPETQWRVNGQDEDGPWCSIEFDVRADAEKFHRDHGGTLVRRELGPWTEVTP